MDMRTASTVLFSAFWAFASAAGADEDAKEIVAKAIKARGGDPTKPIAETWKDKGVLYNGERKLEFTGEWWYQAPDKYRSVLKSRIDQTDVEFISVVNGDKAWQSIAGKSEQLEKEALAHALEQLYHFRIVSLAPLLDKPFTLAALGESTLQGRPVLGVKVSSKDHAYVLLYFDKESRLLSKMEASTKDASQKFKDVKDETLFTDYRQVGGAQRFFKMKVYRDGGLLMESDFSDQKKLENMDEKLFTRP
jgi:hypothetical protein